MGRPEQTGNACAATSDVVLYLLSAAISTQTGNANGGNGGQMVHQMGLANVGASQMHCKPPNRMISLSPRLHAHSFVDTGRQRARRYVVASRRTVSRARASTKGMSAGVACLPASTCNQTVLRMRGDILVVW